ncbi:MAG: hypothetical protein RIA62_01960 [Cyclobacteriaceae bacterium]
MKISNSLPIVIVSLLFSCSPKLIPNSNSEDSLIGTINEAIQAKSISINSAIYFQDSIINKDYLQLLNMVDLKEFESISILAKKEATSKYGKNGKRGIIEIVPFEDETLSSKYYTGITNPFILNQIKSNFEKGKINASPILIINGRPLRGESITTTINELSPSSIKDVIVLEKTNSTALEIYGIRAINGILLLTIEQ